MVKGLEGKTCKEHLRSLALFSLEKRRGCTFLQGRGAVEGRVLIFSLWWPGTGHDEMESRCTGGSSDETWGKASARRGGHSLEEAAQGSGHTSSHSEFKESLNNALVIWFSFKQFCKELYSMLLKGSFQLEAFCDLKSDMTITAFLLGAFTATLLRFILTYTLSMVVFSNCCEGRQSFFQL